MESVQYVARLKYPPPPFLWGGGAVVKPKAVMMQNFGMSNRNENVNFFLFNICVAGYCNVKVY